MKKIVLLALILGIFMLNFTGIAAEAVSVAALKGPTAMGMVKMMQDDAGATYEFNIHASADEITPKLIQGQIDIAALPANLASVLYNRTEGQLQVIAVNTLGVLYIAERGESVQSVEDLRGKTIYSAGKGSTPEYALNYILSANGIDPAKDVTIEYKSEHAECLAAILNDANAVAMLPQPFMTTAMTKAQDMRIALDLTAEWDKLQDEGGSSMITGVVVARSAFVQENPEAVKAFLDAYAASVEFTNANVAEAAAIIGEYGIVTAEVAEKALPYCNICCISGAEMAEKLSGYLAVLYDQNPESVGGTLPDAQFYYNPEA